MQTSPLLSPDDTDASARQLLKKAYVLLNFGHYQKAMIACELAADRGDDPLVAQTLQGAILTASGRPVEAMRQLMGLHRRNRGAMLTALFLAEACFLAGRPRRGFKVLDGLDDRALADSPFEDFASQLRRTFEEISNDDELPAPVVVPFDDDTSE